MNEEESVTEQEQQVDETAEQADKGTRESETAESNEESATSDGDKPKQTGFQRRIDQLTREKYEAQRKAEELQSQLLRQQQQAALEKANTSNNRPPRLEEYGYDETLYMQAVQQWNDNNIKSFQELQMQQAEQAKMQSDEMDRQRKFAEKMASGAEKYHDFNIKVNDPSITPLVQINPAAFEAVLESDSFADVAYYLASNPSEAYAFASMSPLQAVKAVAKLEVKLASKPASQTNNIQPPSEVGGKAVSMKDRDKMTTDEWMEWRESKIQR